MKSGIVLVLLSLLVGCGNDGTEAGGGDGNASTGGTGGVTSGGNGGVASGGAPTNGGAAGTSTGGVAGASGGGGGEPTFDYYISTDGSDSNPGTLAEPWAITALNTKRDAYASKRVGILDGTYFLIDVFGQPSGGWTEATLGIAAGLGENQRTVIQAVHRGKAILDQQKAILASSAEQGIIAPLGSYVTLDGLELKNGNYTAIVGINVGSHLTVQNCYIHDIVFSDASGTGKNAATIFLQNVSNVLIRNCRFEQGGAPADGNRHDFVLVYGAGGDHSSDCTIEYSSWKNVGPGGGNGVYFKTAGGENRNMTLRWNYLDMSESSNSIADAVLWTADYSNSGYTEQIYGNVIRPQPNRSPLRFVNAGAGTVSIHHNDLLGGSWSSDGGVTGTNNGHPSAIDFHDNILTRTQTGFQGDLRYFDALGLGSVDHNLYDASPPPKFVDAAMNAVTSLSAWQALSNRDMLSATAADPLFVGAGADAEAYRLQAGSPAKTLGAGASEVGAWSSGQDAYGIGYHPDRP